MVKPEDTAVHVVAMSISVLTLRKIRYAFFELLEWLLGFPYHLKKGADNQYTLCKVQTLMIIELAKKHAKIGRAYRMVQTVDVLYASKTMQEAEENFNKLHQWMRKSRLAPMKRAADTLKRYRDEILNYFRSRITNAICEGFNSMIQAAKRKARGYHTFEGFSPIIYLIAGKPNFACLNPLR